MDFQKLVWLFILGVFILLVEDVSCLYEDQIGKFDWIQRYVGPVQRAVFDESSIPSRRVIVFTGQNVLAALSTKSGDTLWRHILEPTEMSKVEALINRDTYVSIVINNLIRTWDVITAALKEEVLLELSPRWRQGSFDHIFAFGSSGEDVFLVLLSTGSVRITAFDIASGAVLSGKTLAVNWARRGTKCVITGGNWLVCTDAEGGFVHSINLGSVVASHMAEAATDAQFSEESETVSTENESTLSKETFAVSSVPVSSLGVSEAAIEESKKSQGSFALEAMAGHGHYVVIKFGSDKKLLRISKSGVEFVLDMSQIRAASIHKDVFFSVTQFLDTITIKATELPSRNELYEQSVIVRLPSQSGLVVSVAATLFMRKDGATALRALVTCSDHSVHLVSSAGIVWSREEALSEILASEAVDLPIEGAASSFQDPLHYDADLLTGLLHRMRNQARQLSSWVNGLLGLVSEDGLSDGVAGYLTRDKFNMRKLFVVVTLSGKVLALDTLTGYVEWSVFVPSLSPFENGKILLFTQRTTAHFPRQPQCVVAGRHRGTGEGLLFVFNPLTGVGVEGTSRLLPLGYPLLQVSLLQQMDTDYMKPILLIDTELQPRIFPPEGEAVVLQAKKSMYVHLAHAKSTTLNGYSFKDSKPGNLTLTPVWSVWLGGSSGVGNEVSQSSMTVVGVFGKRATEKVHSQGRVLADRSVLYKYSNPNLVVVVTYGVDNNGKTTLTLHLVDAVTGSVLESVWHTRVSPPFHVVHSENWIVYTSFNEKFRRQEITTLELFEGLSASNCSAFSSVGARPTPPIVEKQVFIMPVGVRAAAHTTTEKGITTKFLLFALSTGNVVQLSKWFLDPRRPMTTTGPREEGLMPYQPELPLPPQEMINHNHSLPRAKSIYTSSTGLESTCLVLVYGLDVFSTRLLPSKAFDVLKDDFDHWVIVGALTSLTIAAVVSRKLAQRKALKQAWK